MGRAFRARSWVTRAAAVLLASAVLSPPAQAAGLFNGSFITVDGLKFTVGNCILNGAGCSTTSPYAEIIAQPGVSSGSAVLIDLYNNNGGSSPLGTSSSGCPVSATCSLSFSLAVLASTGSTAKTTVNKMTTTLSGSANAGHTTNVSDTISFTGLSGWSGSKTIDVGPTTSVSNGTFTKLTNPVGSPISFQVNETISLYNAPGSVLTLNSLAIRFNAAPEPVSIGILLVGLGGLAAARRGRRKTRAPA